jgi:hypothetical protein
MASQVNLSLLNPQKFSAELLQLSDVSHQLWGTPLTCSALKMYKAEMLRGVLDAFAANAQHDLRMFIHYMTESYKLMSGAVMPPPMQVSQAKLLLGAANAYLRALQADVAALENVSQAFSFPDCKSNITDSKVILMLANITDMSPEDVVKIAESLKPKANPTDCYFQMKLHALTTALKKWIAEKKMQMKELETRMGVYNRVIDGIIADMYGEKAATVLQSLTDDLKIYTIAKILNSSVPVLSEPEGDVFARAYTIGQNLYNVTRYGFIINVASPYAQTVVVPKECRDVFGVMKNFLLTLNVDMVNSKYGGLNKLAMCFSLVMKSELNMSLRQHSNNFIMLMKQLGAQENELHKIVHSYDVLICMR